MSTPLPALPLPSQRSGTTFRVLGAISVSHLINDMMQSLILAIYPILKGDFQLSFAQIGLITLTYQLTASLLQPLVGLYTDRRHAPYSLPLGMTSTLCGLLLLAYAPNFASVLLAAAFVGTGSAIFHPESSRVARLASGGRHGFAQSVFQVGGNTGSAIGPLVAAAVIVPFGQRSVAWFGLAALLGIVLLLQVSRWHMHHRSLASAHGARAPVAPAARAQHGGRGDRRVAAADLLEVFLRRRHQQLLHLLSDREIRAVGAKRPGASVHLPVRVGARHAGGRARSATAWGASP